MIESTFWVLVHGSLNWRAADWPLWPERREIINSPMIFDLILCINYSQIKFWANVWENICHFPTFQPLDRCYISHFRTSQNSTITWQVVVLFSERKLRYYLWPKRKLIFEWCNLLFTSTSQPFQSWTWNTFRPIFLHFSLSFVNINTYHAVKCTHSPTPNKSVMIVKPP